MKYYNELDTIAAAITHVYPSAVGIIRVSGPDCFHIVSKIFKPGKKPDSKLNIDTIRSHTIQYGFIYDNDERIDEVMVSFFLLPNTYTREDIAEINCHGNPIILDRVLFLLIQNGARIADPGEFTKRAFLNGRIDLAGAESVMEVISAQSAAGVRNSQKLLQGQLSKSILVLSNKILDEIAFIEASLDDPENYDYNEHRPLLLNALKHVLERIEEFIKSYDYGCLLKNGIKVLFVGLPNSGKSSLFNRMINEERSIVTNIPGTTRDFIESRIYVNDLVLRVIDSAGIVESDNLVEKIGVSRVLELIPQADLILYVKDITCDIGEEEIRVIEQIKDKKNIIILNKIDLCNVFNKEQDFIHIFKKDFKLIRTSAIENIGIRELKELIYDMFINCEQNQIEDITISNARHFNLLCSSKITLTKVLEDFNKGISEDFLVIGLTDVYHDLCEILGVNVSDDVVNRVFESFCVGK